MPRKTCRSFYESILMFAVALNACGADEGDDPDIQTLPDPSALALRGECPMSERLGSFVVYEQETASIVQGEAADGVVPITILTEVSQVDDCRLLKRENPVCEPQCDFDETCNFDETCLPYPQSKDLGEITIDGLNQAVKMTPTRPGNNYFDTALSHPAFDPDRSIRLTSTDGFLGKLEMYGIGVSPLEILDESWALKRDENLRLRWNTPSEDAQSKIRLHASVDQHGSTPVFLVCDLPDTGDASIAAELVGELLDHGTSGFPNASLTRQTVDSQEIEAKGCVEFIVGSPRQGNLELVLSPD